MKRHLSHAALVTCLFAGMAMAQSTIVIPNGYATTEANSSNAFPWGRGTTGYLEIQTMYDSSNFTLQGINYPILISGLRYRANGASTSTGGTYGACTVEMATAALDAMAPSTTFAANMGPDLTTVYTGPVTVAPVAAQTPGIWAVNIPLTTTFLYDPSSNNDLVIFSHIPPPAQSPITGNPSLQLDVQTTGALASRIYNSSTTVYPNATGTTATSHGVVVELTYVPASGLYAGFTATPTSGNSPLFVQFTDRTYTSDPGGVTSWAWDVNGDSVIDYTTQNPSHTYSCGTYNVSLTVTDATHPNSTLTRTGYIVVDQIAADFTASTPGGFAPVNVQFTDTSTGPVTSWSWDLNGDSIPDSTLQNPSYLYAAPGSYTVSLTVTNGCRTNTRTRTNFITVLAPGSVPAPPELFQYQFNEVRGATVANTASTAAAPSTGTVLNQTNWWSDPGRAGFRGNEAGFGCLGYRGVATAGSVNTGWNTAVTGSFSVSMWLRKNPATTGSPFGYAFGNGTFRSFVGGAALTGITFRGTSIGNVDSGFTVDGTPGVWQHVCLVVNDTTGQALWYNNGVPSATVVNFTPNTFTYTSAISFGVGAITGTGGSAIGLGYDLDDFRFYLRPLLPAEVLVLTLTNENASAGAAGSSCPGPGGTPLIAGSGLPTLGNSSFAVNLTNAEDNRLCAIAFGFTPAAAGVFPLTPWLGAGCELQTDAAVVLFHFTASNAASQGLAIPANPTYAGLHVYGQWLVLGTTGADTRLLDIAVH